MSSLHNKATISTEMCWTLEKHKNDEHKTNEKHNRTNKQKRKKRSKNKNKWLKSDFSRPDNIAFSLRVLKIYCTMRKRTGGKWQHRFCLLKDWQVQSENWPIDVCSCLPYNKGCITLAHWYLSWYLPVLFLSLLINLFISYSLTLHPHFILFIFIPCDFLFCFISVTSLSSISSLSLLLLSCSLSSFSFFFTLPITSSFPYIS